jgi:hypothetical protein
VQALEGVLPAQGRGEAIDGLGLAEPLSSRNSVVTGLKPATSATKAKLMTPITFSA